MSSSSRSSGLFLCAFLAICAGQRAVALTNDQSAVITKDTPLTEVEKILGKPQGKLEMGTNITLYYDRGLIDLVDGKVVKVHLVSPEEAILLRQAREREFEELKRQAENNRKRLTLDGQLALKKILADKKFEKQSPQERVAFWQDFQLQYPYTDIGTRLVDAMKEAGFQKQQRANQEEVVRLKAAMTTIHKRLLQLDAEYASSLAHWKRNEINTERAKLNLELNDIDRRIKELSGR